MISDEYAKEIQSQIEELRKERKKLQTINFERNRYTTVDARQELYYELVAEKIEELPNPVFNDIIVNDELVKSQDLLMIADIHCGAHFKSLNNEYSYAICEQRFKKLLAETIKYVKHEQLSTIKVATGGDTIQGILRLSDLKLNESTAVESTVIVSKLIANFLNELSAYCYVEYYHCPTGNHSQNRNLGSKAGELASEDMEFVIGNYIKDMLSHNERVEINLNLGKEFIEIPIFNFNTILMHGHQIKNIKDSLKDLSMLHQKFYQYVFLAHYHSGTEMTVGESSLSNCEVLVSPSFIGSDPYSDKLMLGSKPMCKIYKFDETDGHIGTRNIILN